MTGAPVREHPVAVTGMAIRLGPADGLRRFAAALQEGHSLIGSRPADRWKACDGLLPGLAALGGAYIDAVAFDAGRFRIPPIEIPDILPQHLLMLQVAAEAMQAAKLPLRADRPRMGAVIGVDFDFGATDFHLRWHLAQAFPGWVRARFPHADPATVDRWLAHTMDACAPPLTATRVLGSLGSMVASRIAREFRLGGPSFVASAAAASGLAALEIAARAIRTGELDCALVGAVDFGGDLRSALLKQGPDPDGPPVSPADGAVALVLKRLDRAEADGDPIHAVLRGLGSAGLHRAADAMAAALSEAGLEEAAIGVRVTHGLRDGAGAPGDDLRALAGDCGAAGGLAAVVAAALRLQDAPTAVRFALAGADTADGGSHRAILERPAAVPERAARAAEPSEPDARIRVASAGRPLRLPPPPAELTPAPREPSEPPPPAAAPGFRAAAAGLAAASEATARAHAAFLEISAELTRTCARALDVQRQLLERGGHSLPPLESDPVLRRRPMTAPSASSSRAGRPPGCWARSSRRWTPSPRASGCRTSRSCWSTASWRSTGTKAASGPDASSPSTTSCPTRGTSTAAGRRCASRSRPARPTSSSRPGSGSTSSCAAAAPTACSTRPSNSTATCPPPGRPSATPSRSRSSCGRATPISSSSASTGPSRASP